MDFDFAKAIVKLSPKNAYEANGVKYKSGYLVREKGYLTAGLGLSSILYVSNTNGIASVASAAIGLLPMVNKKSMVIRHASSHEIADANGKRSIPKSYADLKTWSVNDMMAYESTGGLVTFGTLGIPGLSTGAAYVYQGGYETVVQKISKTEVVASHSSKKIKTFSKALLAGITSFYDEDSSMNETTPVFSFDLSKANAQKAYSQFIEGNMILAQQMSARSSSGVTALSSRTSNTVTDAKGNYTGLPIFFNVQNRRSTSMTASNTLVYSSETNEEEDKAEYSDSSTSGGILSRHYLERSQMIVVADLDKRDMFAALFMWEVEKERASDGWLKRKFINLFQGKVTALQVDALQYADVLDHKQESGFTRVQMTLNMNEQSFSSLGALKSRTYIQKAANWAYETVMATETITKIDRRGPRSSSKRVPNEALAKKVYSAVFEMEKQYKLAAKAISRKDDKAFTLAMSKFAEAAFTHNTTSEILTAVGRKLNGELRVEGEMFDSVVVAY